MENSKQDAIDFLNNKSAEFRNKLSALFLKYGISKPVTGGNLASLILLNSDISKEILSVVNNESSFDGATFLDKLKDSVGKAKEIVTEVKTGIDTANKKKEEEAKKADEGSQKYILVGLAIIVILIIIFVIIKKARG